VEISPGLMEPNGKEELIQSFGKWNLERLGYQEFVISCQNRYGAVSLPYLLPADAGQGPENWYVLDLDLQIEFGQDSLEGECEVRVYANNAICTNFNFYSRTDDGTLRFYQGDSAMASPYASVTYSDYMPGHHLIINGVQPGRNFLSILLVKYGGIDVKSLWILNSSGVECVSVPQPGSMTAAKLQDLLPKLAPAEEVRARDIALNDLEVRELIAGREFSIDAVSEWDLPQAPGREARVDISLDTVYQIEYDWPWPPLPIRESTHHDTFWVREITVVVSLDEGTVLGIMPERHPVFADPKDLPEDSRPPGYIIEPEVEIPQLTAEETATAKQMALDDARVKELVAGKGFAVAPGGRIGVWHTDDLKKIGAVLEIWFDKAYWLNCDELAKMELDEDNPGYSDYLNNICSDGGLWADRLLVSVDLEVGKVVGVVPMPVLQYGGEQ
jgi:hypothetical protein